MAHRVVDGIGGVQGQGHVGAFARQGGGKQSARRNQLDLHGDAGIFCEGGAGHALQHLHLIPTAGGTVAHPDAHVPPRAVNRPHHVIIVQEGGHQLLDAKPEATEKARPFFHKGLIGRGHGQIIDFQWLLGGVAQPGTQLRNVGGKGGKPLGDPVRVVGHLPGLQVRLFEGLGFLAVLAGNGHIAAV